MKAFIKKLTSRKFLTCMAGIVLGVCMTFGLDEGAVNTVAGAATSIVSVIVYIYTEGKIDAAAVKNAVDKIEEASEEVKNIEE